MMIWGELPRVGVVGRAMRISENIVPTTIFLVSSRTKAGLSEILGFFLGTRLGRRDGDISRTTMSEYFLSKEPLMI